MKIDRDKYLALADLEYACRWASVSYALHFDESDGRFWIEIDSAAPGERFATGSTYFQGAVQQALDGIHEYSRGPLQGGEPDGLGPGEPRLSIDGA